MTAVPLSPRGRRDAPGGLRAHWLTCALDGRDHAVVDHDPDSGAHLSACAKTVWASSLASPPATRCSDCRQAVSEPSGEQPRPSLLGRWLGRRAA